MINNNNSKISLVTTTLGSYALETHLFIFQRQLSYQLFEKYISNLRYPVVCFNETFYCGFNNHYKITVSIAT